MSRRTPRALLALAACAALALGAPGAPAFAEDAPTDSLLHRFLHGLADSSDTYFGITAVPTDTAGLDSALAEGLAHPGAAPRRPSRLSWGPDLAFNRVDGPYYGLGLGYGRRYGAGRLNANAGYAVGPNDWRGGLSYSKSFRQPGARWHFVLDGSSASHAMDRDASDVRLGQLRAFLAGADTRRYLLREGVSARIERERPTWRLSATFRAMDESPLDVTTTWNLAGATPVVPDNVAATRGRNHEFEYEATARLPRLPFTAEVNYTTSGHSIGSDFEFRRTHVTLSGDVRATRWLSLVPQAVYGRLTGQMAPQDAFYLGGSRSLRAIEGYSLGGTGVALARLDAIFLPDLLELARLPHPDALPIQGALFGAIGAVWGRDPYGGPGGVEEDFPEHYDWLPEAGLSLLYRPGLPDPDGFLRFSWAYRLGPDRGGARFTVTYSRGVDLLKPLGLD